MKKHIIQFFASAILSASAFAYYEPTGTCLTWFGYNALDMASGDYSAFFGSYSGKYGSTLDYSSFVGVMSGAYASNLKSCNAIGYYAMSSAYDSDYIMAFGPHAGQDSYYNRDCVFIGRNAGREVYNCDNCLFIGNGAGRAVRNASGVVDLNGRIVLADDDLSVDADNIILRANRTAFYYSDADVYMSDGYGSDTNTGRSASSPVRTIGRAVAVVNALVDAGTIPTNVPPVVVADCGKYESATFSVTDKLNPRRIVFKSACGKMATFLVPHYNGNTNNGDPEMDPLNCQDGNVEFHDFTMTRFDGVSDSEVDHSLSTFNKAAVNVNVKLIDCDVCRNRPSVHYSFLACSMENCDIYDNYFRSYNGYAAMVVFGHAFNGGGTIKNCRIYRNNFVASRLFYHNRAENCLIVNSHFYSTTTFTNCTIIADHFMSTHILGQNERGMSASIGRNFIVCPDFNLCSTVNPYRTNDNCVCVASANLTKDYIAADENCPSVCDNGLPDFGYRTSMFGYYKSLRRIAAQVRNIAPDSVAIDKADGTGRVVIRNANGSLRVSDVTITPDEPDDEEDEGGNAPQFMSAPPQGNADDGEDDNTQYRVITR